MFNLLAPKNYDVDPRALPKSVTINNLIGMAALSAMLFTLFFKFPIQESIEGKVEIYDNGAPVSVKAKTTGELNLMVDNLATVEKGQVLGYYNWNISEEEARLLEALSEVNFNPRDAEGVADFERIINDLKGANTSYLQGEISSVVAAYNIYNMSLEQKSFGSYVQSEKARIESLESNQRQSRQVLANRQRQLSTLRDHITADRELLNKGILSQREFDLKKRAYEQEMLEIEERSLSITSMNNDIKDIESSIELGKHNLALTELENYKALLSAIDAYKKLYFSIREEKVILAPRSGKVNYADLLKFTNNPQVGDEILTILMNQGNARTEARIILGTESIGRVKKGDHVMISLDAYPIEQYGIVKASIKNIESLMQSGQYIYPLSLNDGLSTSYQIDLLPLPQLNGTGDILIGRTNIFNIIKDEILATRARLKLDASATQTSRSTAQQY